MNTKFDLKENKKYLETILPHKKPMILIDNVIDYNFEENWLKCIVTIREDSLFFDKSINGISSIIGIEYMAQTIGCYAYLKAKLDKPRIGFLLGSRGYNNKLDKFSLNESYIIEVKEIFSGNEIVSFECLIYNNDKEVANATINAYQVNDENEIINFIESNV